MKSFVITITDMKESVQCAKRCIASMPEFDVQIWEAYTPKDKPEQIMRASMWNTGEFYDKYSHPDNCMAAFLSHHDIWGWCFQNNEEVQIFEHDAVATGNIPEYIPHNGCISLGRPSYGRFNTPSVLGPGPLVSKNYFPGAHAYRLKPAAAKKLLQQATVMPRPTDLFLNKIDFPWLQEYYPWPVEAKDTFTTIQKVAGCEAKHNYNSKYTVMKDVR
jgi:GR25 family glycosyltransferase involved in LPS biosynthesis